MPTAPSASETVDPPHYMDKETLRPLGKTVDEKEVAKFAAMAEEWWDADGKFKPLHNFNPVRIAYIRDHLCKHFGLDARSVRPLKGLRILDIGCGGGLLCEPLARLGAEVTGVDATEKSIHVAKTHAAQMGLDIDYRFARVESLLEDGEAYDVVLNMEVVEHVSDVEAFMGTSADLVRSGGLMFVATLNRTPKSFALAIVGAEYVLGWLPKGTHDWRKFMKPSEIAAAIRPHGMTVRDLTGVTYNPISDVWKLNARDVGVNYLMLAERG